MSLLGCSGGGSSGPDRIGDRAEFTGRAAAICGEVVSRRNANPDYAKDRRAILEALVAVRGKGLPAADAIAALDRAVREFEHTTRDLARVRSTDATWAAAWAEVADAVRGDTQVYRDRRAAVRAGDPATLAAAFDPGRLASDIGAPLTRLNLAERDCRLLLR
ncbi:hypothetical protein [Embleya sp. NPDC020886]|uniref:hypothetical protein n=1 Tax=Embleya sp. NPDC020886 TaxID=3363980 RepID=UPI0037B726D3